MKSAMSRTVWRHRDLRALATGQGLSWLGDSFAPIALAVGIATSGGGATELGVPLAAAMVGRVVFTLVGGVWGDRLQPVRVMAVSDVARAALAASLALVFATGTWNVAVLALLMGLSGAAAAFFHPAFAALKPRLVPDGEQQASNAGLAMLATGTRVAGPALAGAVVALAGPAVGFTVNAVCFTCSAILVLRVRVRPERNAPGSFWQDLREEAGAVLDRPWLASGILAATIYHIGNGVLLVLLPLIVVRDLGGSASLGIVESSMAAGALVGGLLAARMRPRRPLVTAFAVLLLSGLGFLGLARPERLPLVALFMAVGFGALMVFGVLWETTIQREIPHGRLARVNAWDQMASFAVFPLGALLAGPPTAAFGEGPVVLGCVGILLLSPIVALVVRDTWRIGGLARTRSRRRPTSPTLRVLDQVLAEF